MKKQTGWNSEFQKRKFYEKQENKREILGGNERMLRRSNPQTIAVMLDLDGTVDFMDDAKAKLFMRQLEFIRAKFGAQFGTISISTHYNNPDKMQDPLTILARNLSKNMKIGLNFYYGGTYDYAKKENLFHGGSFNQNKVATFDQFYVNSFQENTQWFGIFDDGISKDVYKQYQMVRPMLLCRPSQAKETKNCFMSIATCTQGFDGVLESLDSYIQSIRHLSKKEILEKQKTMICHLSSFELLEAVQKRDFLFLERYFQEGYADDSDYTDVLNWIFCTYDVQSLNEKEAKQLQKLLTFFFNAFHLKKDEENKSKVHSLLRKLPNGSGR